MKIDNLQNEFHMIFEVIIAFYSEKDYFGLLDVILSKMMEMTNADAGTLYVLDNEALYFRIMKNISLGISQGGADIIDLPPIVLDENNITNISAYAAIKNKIVAIDDVYNNEQFNFSGPKQYDKITGYHTCSMLVFPLTTKIHDTEEVIGVIQLINAIDDETGKIKAFGNIFDPPILQALSNIAANALANLTYAKEIKDLFNSFVKVMTTAIDERSPYNTNHTNNVARYCEKFVDYLNSRFEKGQAFYFDTNRREQLIMAAFLHDIGKLVTPLYIMNKPTRLHNQLQSIQYKFEIKKHQLEIQFLKNEISREQYENELLELSGALDLIETSNMAGFLTNDKIKEIISLVSLTYFDETGQVTPILTNADIKCLCIQKGTLTDEERKIMQDHVAVTGKLLEKIKFNQYYKNVPFWASSHHEFLDGSGYPLQMKGPQLTLEICILSMIDIYDALTANDRPYKKAMRPEKALGVLREMVEENKLDKELVELFCESGVWQ